MLQEISQLIEQWGEAAADAKDQGATKIMIDIPSFARMLEYCHGNLDGIAELERITTNLRNRPEDLNTLRRVGELMCALSEVATYISPQDEETMDSFDSFLSRYNQSGVYMSDEDDDDDRLILFDDDDDEFEYTDVPMSSFRRESNDSEMPEDEEDEWTPVEAMQTTVAVPEKKGWMERLLGR